MATLRLLGISFILVSQVVCSDEDCSQICFNRFQQLPVLNTAECSTVPSCNPKAKYRTIDGSCSNLAHSFWGQAGTPFIRILPATYYDGKYEPRKSVNGQPLPNVRNLSTNFFPDQSVLDTINTLNVMQWGQVLAHDVTHLRNRQTDTLTSSTQVCCTNDNQLPENLPEICLPIEVSSDDYFYSQFKVRCLSYIRARVILNGTCHTFPIEQLNAASHVLDASLVYGSDIDTADSLRSFVNGKLIVQLSEDGRQFPPNAEKPAIPCFNPSTEHICYLTGDDRVNQNPDITVYQIVLLRLHNFLCDKLHKINPHWNDEKLYQEARRILIAFIEHVTFKHFLPVILGKEFMYKKGLMLNNCHNCCLNYHIPGVNPSTFNEFAGAAYRSFHTLVPRETIFLNEKYGKTGSILMDDYYFRPSFLQTSGILDKCLRGLANQRQESADQYFTVALTNLLFKNNKSWGNDLESTDIQRGRDLGLPPYNKMRQVCGHRKALNFRHFRDVMSKQSIKKLKSFYANVNDVDLFVGGMMENLIPGTLVGPTFQCIIGEQFYHYKHGNRFYYENCGLPWSFSKDQINAIYKTSVAWLFCEVGDNIRYIQYDIFQKPSKHNHIVLCNKIPTLDLRPWKE